MFTLSLSLAQKLGCKDEKVLPPGQDNMLGLINNSANNNYDEVKSQIPKYTHHRSIHSHIRILMAFFLGWLGFVVVLKQGLSACSAEKACATTLG